MRTTIALILIFIFTLSCVSESIKKNQRSSKLSGKNRSASSSPHKQRFSPHRSSPQVSLGAITFPTIVHERDHSTMALVDPEQTQELNSQRGILRATSTGLDTVFYIDLTEISVEQYRRFDPKYDEKRFTDNRDCPQCPAMGIDWYSATKYCQWAQKRLPTEAEWEMAARGGSNQPLPWGDEPGHANLFGGEDGYPSVAPVASFPSGASPYGVLDMTGNVWEWVSETDTLDTGTLKAVKGGGWTSDIKDAAISNHNLVPPDMKNPTFGFRCVKPAFGKKIAP